MDSEGVPIHSFYDFAGFSITELLRGIYEDASDQSRNCIGTASEQPRNRSRIVSEPASEAPRHRVPRRFRNGSALVLKRF